MPTKIVIEKWEVPQTNGMRRMFDSEAEAIAFEQQQIKSRIEAEFLKKSHSKDDKYRIHCVDCGVLLIEWERKSNGVETYRGSQILNTQPEVAFEGHRCYHCHNKLLEKIIEALEAKYGNSGNQQSSSNSSGKNCPLPF